MPTSPYLSPKSKNPASGKVSGPELVFTLFGTAFLFFGIIFFFAYRQKISDDQSLLQEKTPRIELIDSAITREEIVGWLKKIPTDWTRITYIEGQGYVRFIPCYSSNEVIHFEFQSNSLPKLICEFCDSITNIPLNKLSHLKVDSSLDFNLSASLGNLRLFRVTEELQAHFQGAPLQNQILVWERNLEDGKMDSLVFIEKNQEIEFEVLKAEDENPEGCAPEPNK